MRLALIHNQFGGSGGLEGYLAGLAGRLLKAGHFLDVITSEVVESAPHSTAVLIHQIPPFPVLRSQRLLHFNREAARKLARLKVDFALGFGQTTSQDVHRAGGGCHAVYSRSLPAVKRLSPKNRIELKLERELYTSGKTRHFVVNARKVADELQAEYAVAPSRISVIHTPVDTATFHPPEEIKWEVRCRLLPETNLDLPLFFFVSLNHKRKGLDYLLDIWPDIPGELWIAGAPVDSAKLGPNIHYLGKRKDLADLYRAADCFVHPTLYDACANTVLQAMATALPCIVSANDGAVDFISDGENGLVLSHPSLLSQQIGRFLDLPGYARDEMGERARERILEQTWDVHLAKWMAVLEKLEPRS